MRLFCMGMVIEWDAPGFEPLLRRMAKKRIEGARAVILLDVFKVVCCCWAIRLSTNYILRYKRLVGMGYLS